MAKTDTKAPRERYREQVRSEVKAHAWEQIATAGASALSLNAIAKQMGMSGPALYRYYGSRDELITELIADAYRSLASTLQAAAAADEGAEGAEGAGGAGGADLAALAYVIRTWALEDPHRYFLIYGTPVPGYHAPPTTTAISSEIMAVLLAACTALPENAPATRSTTPLAVHLAEHRTWAPDPAAPPAALHLAMTFWTRIHGVLSLELAGHFAGMGFDPARLFAAEVEDLLNPHA